MELNQIKSLLIDLFKNDFSQPDRQRHNVYQRAVFCRLCRELTPYSLSEIGKLINKDHASVLYGLKLFNSFKIWNEDMYLTIYKKAKLKLEEKYNFANPCLQVSVEDKYKKLFFNHILLKEKYYKTKLELDKIRNFKMVEKQIANNGIHNR